MRQRDTSQNRIRQMRELRGMTMAQLAQRTGTTASQINKLEKGKVRLAVDWLDRLAHALGCRSIDLLFDTPTPPAHIDAELLRHSLFIAHAISQADDGLGVVIEAELVARVYDHLFEERQERGSLDEATIDTIIRTYRHAGPR